MASALSTSALRVAAPRTARPSRRTSVVVAASGSSSKANWFPGKSFPAHLETSDLPGNFGFDPLNLGSSPDSLSWYVQAELQHARWAMLGVAGVLVQELFRSSGLGGPAAQVPWFDAGKETFWAPTPTLVGIQVFLMAWVEIRRLQDYRKPGSANQDPIFTNNKLPDGNVPGYPGGIFDFLGFAKGGDVASLKQKEIKNGRLAMLAFLGFVAQHSAQGGSPLDNLGIHLADPWSNNFLTNSTSLPFTAAENLNFLGGSAGVFTSVAP